IAERPCQTAGKVCIIKINYCNQNMEATSDETSKTFFPTAEYAVDGRTYSKELYQGSSSYREGKIITVFYNPDDPAVVHAKGVKD
ncbi:MAG: DUF3592 domain-containing protein, partial [Acetatifactor sp.]|nr:DUF3592 domain-containing protein [Acetatifactor sp.]